MFLPNLSQSRRSLISWGLGTLLALSGPGMTGQEAAFVSLKDTVRTEVQARAFTLPKAMRVHVYAKGGGLGGRPFYAYGWILDATTREVVWQMDGRTAKPDGDFQVADQYLDLKAGTYEAYYSNHGYGWTGAFSRGTRGIDRRRLIDGSAAKRRDRFGFRAIAESVMPGGARRWEPRARHYGMELYAQVGDAVGIRTARGPAAWRGEVLALRADRDRGAWRDAFKVSRPVTLHIYCQGERKSTEALADTGWILDARTRKPVWEMDAAKADYAGGADKNRRQVQTITLPAGEYIAGYGTDDSHSPAHWNASPSCDPLRYGLFLSLPREGDAAAFTRVAEGEPGKVLATQVQVGNHHRGQTTFVLPAPASVRVYALGEADHDDLADRAWITNAAGARVWSMTLSESLHAGGARKNRVQDQVLSLPAGTFTLHVETDGSHACGDWNDAPPRDAAHYGATIYAAP